MTIKANHKQTATATLKFNGPHAPIHAEWYDGGIGIKGQGHKTADSIAYESWEACVANIAEAVAVEAAPSEPWRDEEPDDTRKRIKNTLPYLGPYALREGEDKRCDANVDFISLLVADCDRCDLYAVIERIGELDIAAIVYTSPSDHDGLAQHERKFRVVCPLSRHIEPSDCEHTRLAFAEAIGLGPGCGQEEVLPEHLGFYAGRMPGAPEREFYAIDGGPIDVDVLMASPLQHDWAASPARDPNAKPVDKSPLPPIGEVEPRDEPVLAALLALHKPPGGFTGRRMKLRATGSYLAKRGLNDTRIAALVSRIPTERGPKHCVKEAIVGARDQRAGVKNVAGWKQLKALNEGAADVLDRALDSPRERAVREADDARRAAKEAEAEAKKAAEPQAANTNSGEDDCPPGTPGTEPPPPDPSEDDWDAPEVPIEWYCEGLGIAPSERKVTLLAGMPGSGKGPFAGHLAVSFALGLSVLGAFPCKQCNVGILDYEGRRLSMRRIRAIARGLKRDPKELKGRVFVRDCDPGAPADLHEWIAARNIEVLIADSYMTAMSASDADPNSPGYAKLAQELGALGIVVIVVAHTRKLPAGKTGESLTLGDVAGSYALGGMAATGISVWNPNDDDRMLVRVKCLRAPDEAFSTFDVRWAKDHDAPKEAEVWTGRMVGAASRKARTEVKEQNAKDVRDAHLTEAADKLIGFMARTPCVPFTARGLREADVHDRDIKSVLAALLVSGHVTFEPSTAPGERTSGRWLLVMPANGKPPQVVFCYGVAQNAPRLGDELKRKREARTGKE